MEVFDELNRCVLKKSYGIFILKISARTLISRKKSVKV